MGLGLSIQSAVLTWVMVTQYDLSLKEVGIVWSVGPLAVIVGTIVVGILSDKAWFWGGRRRPFIIIGGISTALAFFALPNIGFIASNVDLFTILGVAIAISLFIDLSINVSFNPSRALIADVTPLGSVRARSFLWMQTISGSVSVIGYAIGAIFGNYVLIYTGGIVILLLMIFPILFVQECKEQHEHVEKEVFSLTETLQIIRPLWGLGLYAFYAMALNFANLPGHIVIEAVIGIVALYFLVETVYKSSNASVSENIFQFQKNLAANSVNWFGPFSIFMFLVVLIKYRMQDIDDAMLGEINNWSLFIFNGVAIVFPILVLRRFVDKYGMLATHIGSLWFMVLALVLLYFFGYSAHVIWGIMLMAGIAWSSMITLPFAMYSQYADSHRMGYFTGLYNLSMIFPMLIVSLRFGVYMDAAENKGIIFMISAAMVVISIGFWNQIKKTSTSEGM